MADELIPSTPYLICQTCNKRQDLCTCVVKKDFFEQVNKFNEFYKIPQVENTKEAFDKRLANFQSILKEELQEMNFSRLSKGGALPIDNSAPFANLIDYKVAMADWLGDIIVYCASEAKRFDIPIEQVLQVIMDSNFSKADENGDPIYDERGKVCKGPNFFPPEDKIRKLLNRG